MAKSQSEGSDVNSRMSQSFTGETRAQLSLCELNEGTLKTGSEGGGERERVREI